jgi:hypothetical protein
MNRALFASLFVVGQASACGGLQPAQSVQMLLARLAAIRAATDFRASARLVRIAPSGERRNYRLSLRGRSIAGTLRLFCEITDPPPARVRLLLAMPESGLPSVRKGRAGDSRPLALPPEAWADPVLDTGFSYEDLLENHFLWARQALIEQTRYGARLCYRLRSVPAPADRSQYVEVISWLDRDSLFPVRLDKRLPSGAVKSFLYYGLRESKGIWSASQVEVKTSGLAGSSLLIVTRGSEKARVGAAEFDPALLIRP